MLSTFGARCATCAAALLTISLCNLVNSHAARAADTMTVEIVADDMCCTGCAKKVAAQLFTAPGVIDVKPDVPSRLVTITARPTRNLTLDKLWNAVAKAKGGPSKLTAGGVAYSFVAAATLPATVRLKGNVYRVVVTDLTAHQSADQVAQSIRGLRGVSQVALDSAPDALLITPAADAALSPWALIGAVQQAKEQPVSIDSPLGRMSIEQVITTNNVSTRPQTQGAVR